MESGSNCLTVKHVLFQHCLYKKWTDGAFVNNNDKLLMRFAYVQNSVLILEHFSF